MRCCGGSVGGYVEWNLMGGQHDQRSTDCAKRSCPLNPFTRTIKDLNKEVPMAARSRESTV